ncbi:MAG: EamA family transporter, partial [Bacteroidota bacterium]
WFIWATCSALLSALSAVVQKKILFRLNALEFSFSVSLVIFFFTAFVPLFADVLSIPLSTVAVITVKSVLGASAFLLVMVSLQQNQISSALPLLGITPAAAAILSLLFLGEALKESEWLGIGIMITGAYLLEKRPSSTLFQPLRRIVRSKTYYSIYGAVGLFALSSVLDRLLVYSMKTDLLNVLFYQHIVYLLFFSVILMIRRFPLRAVVSKSGEEFPLIFTVAILTLAYRYTQLEATVLAPVALVLAVKRTSILYASLLGGKLFSEDRLPTKLLGAVLIVAAGFIILRNAG